MLGVFRFALKWSMTFPGFQCVIRPTSDAQSLRECPTKILNAFLSQRRLILETLIPHFYYYPLINLSLISSSFWQWLYNTSAFVSIYTQYESTKRTSQQHACDSEHNHHNLSYEQLDVVLLEQNALFVSPACMFFTSQSSKHWPEQQLDGAGKTKMTVA